MASPSASTRGGSDRATAQNAPRRQTVCSANALPPNAARNVDEPGALAARHPERRMFVQGSRSLVGEPGVFDGLEVTNTLGVDTGQIGHA